MGLTAEVLAVGQGLSKLSSHVDVQMPAELDLDLSGFHTTVDHLLYAIGVQSVHNVTNPLLVDVDPVTGIWQVLENVGFASGIFQEILNGQTFDLRNC